MIQIGDYVRCRDNFMGVVRNIRENGVLLDNGFDFIMYPVQEIVRYGTILDIVVAGDLAGGLPVVRIPLDENGDDSMIGLMRVDMDGSRHLIPFHQVVNSIDRITSCDGKFKFKIK